MELGTDKVQGVDYAYTLQGWLKGINSQFLGADKDMAGDGNSSGIYAPYGRDVYSMSLGYYGGDYTPIGGSGAPAFSLSYTAPVTLATSGNSLYNGNISHSTVALSKLNGGLPVGYSYGYDQLNRLLAMRQHAIGSTTSSWGNSDIIQDYREDIAYDANGNILKYFRNASTQGSHPLGMDSLTYLYEDGTNQLTTIYDSVPSGNYNVDIDNQAAINYAYDSIGNMIKDNASGITSLGWTVYGKPRKIVKSGSTINFFYDASGQRIVKEVTGSGALKQYYIKDAQGNTLAIYNYDGMDLLWAEQDLYGSRRLGTWSWSNTIPNRVMVPGTESDTLSDWYFLGGRRFELSNHLGSVMALLSDKKVGVSSDGSTTDYYRAEVLSQQDYYPFGMQEPGRHSQLAEYHFGFIGAENDNEIAGEGNSQDHKFRSYDPRLGRYRSLDPLSKSFPWSSPYAYAENRVIDGLDLEGREYIAYHHYFNGAVSKTEFYKMTDKEIRRLGGTTAGYYYSVPFGPGGRGIVHYIYDNAGNLTQTRWEQRQTGGMEDVKFHGLYSGPGSVTHDGFKESTKYDFNEQPIDWADAIAKRHDMDYAAVASENYKGYLEDVRTLQADRDMIARIDDFIAKNSNKIPGMELSGPEGVETPVRMTTSPEFEWSLFGQRILINALATYKQWKIDNNLGNDDKYKDHRGDFKKAHPGIVIILDQLPNE